MGNSKKERQGVQLGRYIQCQKAGPPCMPLCARILCSGHRPDHWREGRTIPCPWCGQVLWCELKIGYKLSIGIHDGKHRFPGCWSDEVHNVVLEVQVREEHYLGINSIRLDRAVCMAFTVMLPMANSNSITLSKLGMAVPGYGEYRCLMELGWTWRVGWDSRDGRDEDILTWIGVSSCASPCSPLVSFGWFWGFICRRCKASSGDPLHLSEKLGFYPFPEG